MKTLIHPQEKESGKKYDKYEKYIFSLSDFLKINQNMTLKK